MSCSGRTLSAECDTAGAEEARATAQGSVRRLFCAGVFPQRQALVKTPGAIRPGMPMSAQTIFPHRGAEASALCKRLITVEGYGQICMGCTVGNLAGVRVDAAGKVHGKHKRHRSCADGVSAHRRQGRKAAVYHGTRCHREHPQQRQNSGFPVQNRQRRCAPVGSADVQNCGWRPRFSARPRPERTVTSSHLFAAARAITNPSPPLLPFPQTTSSLPGCKNCFCSSA